MGLNGSGVVIINPPWKFDALLQTFIPWLWKTLSANGAGNYKIEWLHHFD
jgi:23S rRNA (adenine2030-N6)-methyltransferase